MPSVKMSGRQLADAQRLMNEGIPHDDAMRLAYMYGEKDEGPILGWPAVVAVMAVAIGICLYFHLF